MAMYNTDLLIALGVRFDDRVTGRLAAFAPHARVIHVDIDPAEIGKNRHADIPIVGDLKRVLQKMNKVVAELKPEIEAKKSDARKSWWRQIREWKAEHPFDSPRSESEIKPQHLMAEIDRISGGKAIVTSDVGQHQMWAAQYIRFDEPGSGSTPAGWGRWATACLPRSVRSSAARTSWCSAIAGDGGFQMSLPELATIVNQGLPIKIIVMNNGYLGMVRQWQELFYNNRMSSVTLDTFPQVGIACRRVRIQGPHGRESGRIDARRSKTAVAEPGPYLLNVKVTPFENVYPMVPAGGAINEMVLGPPQPVAVGD